MVAAAASLSERQARPSTAIQLVDRYLILDGLGCAIVVAHLAWTEKVTDIVLNMKTQGIVRCGDTTEYPSML